MYKGFTLGRMCDLRWARRTSRGVLAAAWGVGISALKAITYVTQREKMGLSVVAIRLGVFLRFALAD